MRLWRHWVLGFLLVAARVQIVGQEVLGQIHVEVHANTDVVAEAEVVVEGSTERTDAAGVAVFQAAAGTGKKNAGACPLPRLLLIG